MTCCGPEYVLDAPDADWNFEPSREELFRSLRAALYTTDADGWLTYYNEAAAALWVSGVQLPPSSDRSEPAL